MITAATLAGAVFALILVGFLALIRIGMNRERGRFLSTQAPTRLAGATRAIAGLHVIMPGRDLQVLSPTGPDDPHAGASATSTPAGPRPSNGALS